MGTPPPDVTFKKADFPSSGLGSQDALDKLFLPLNSALSAIRQLLSGSLSAQNMNAEVKTVSVTTPGSGMGVLSCFPLKVATKIKQPIGVLLLGALDKSTSPGVPSLGVPSWTTNSDGTLSVTNVPGLLLGRTYALTLQIVGS